MPTAHGSGGGAESLAKDPVELRERLETGFVGDFRDAFAAVQQQSFGMLDAHLRHILAKSQPGSVMEHPR